MAEPLVSKSGPNRQPVRLTPMPVPKASDVLADDLRERILLGEFPEGTALPTERDLVAQTQMSRATVREALRILGRQICQHRKKRCVLFQVVDDQFVKSIAVRVPCVRLVMPSS